MSKLLVSFDFFFFTTTVKNPSGQTPSVLKGQVEWKTAKVVRNLRVSVQHIKYHIGGNTFLMYSLLLR